MINWNVLFVGLGPLGRMIVDDYLGRRLGRIAGVVDVDPSLAGRRLDEAISGREPSDVKIVASLTEALARIDPMSLTCAVVATSSDLAQCMPTLRELLSRGLSIVSTCEELLYPWLRHEAAAKELEALCAKHGGRCVGTGVNPGFMMDTLPVALTAVCHDVRRVRVERFQDASTRRVPFQQKIGAALSDAEFARRAESGVLRHVGLGESIHFIDRFLSLGVVKWDETLEPVRAARAMTCAVGKIAPGGISGVHQTARAWNAAGDEVITLDFQAAIGQENPRDRVVIEGKPSIESIIPGAVHGDVATSAITLNTIGSLMRAPPGLHTMATLPLTRCAR
ncbi:MAG: dihydrodipicolinate reductase [Phycisphaerae bacterium]|nr:dihydrodipicolinate reductase [Phycisphaerae bacterium]